MNVTPPDDWETLDHDDDYRKSMVNTNMVVACPLGTNCTSIKSLPGANVASPVAMFLTGTIGNAVALMVLHHSSRREQTRTVFYLLVGSLVWTDLMGIVLTSIPVLVVYTNGRWVGSTGLCNYHAFTMISIGLITPCIVCTMAVERFLGIRHTFLYKRRVSRHRMRLVLLVQWIAVLVFTSLPFFGFGQYARQYPGTWCFFDLHAQRLVHVAYAFSFAGFIVALIAVIIGCNVAVIAALIAMRRRRRHLNSSPKDRQTIYHCQKDGSREIEMVILLVGITLLFTTCWLPLMIQIFLNQIFDYKNDHRRDLLAIRLVSINQTFDPWIYILFRKVILVKFWHFVRHIFTGKSSDETIPVRVDGTAAASAPGTSPVNPRVMTRGVAYGHRDASPSSTDVSKIECTKRDNDDSALEHSSSVDDDSVDGRCQNCRRMMTDGHEYDPNVAPLEERSAEGHSSEGE